MMPEKTHTLSWKTSHWFEKAGAVGQSVSKKLLAVPLLNFIYRLQQKTGTDYIGLIAAGIAFYFLLAAFPAIAAMISLYGLIADPADITAQFNYFARFLPREAFELLTSQALKVASSHEGILSLGVIIGLLVAISSASRGVQALIKGFNIAFDTNEHRNMVSLNVTSYLLTFVMLFYFLLSLSLVAGVPLVVEFFLRDTFATAALEKLRWPLLLVIGMVGLEILYYYGPCRKNPVWHWISWGSFTATALWLLSSILFSFFVSHTASYNETYGSLGAVIILMLWFWISALMIMLGAEINAMRERNNTYH